MERITVDSEAMKWIAYNKRRRELDIEFPKNGDVYRYFDVTPVEFNEFLAADSKGTYLNQIFKQRNHSYRIIRHGHR